jgi:hypothetical protein
MKWQGLHMTWEAIVGKQNELPITYDLVNKVLQALYICYYSLWVYAHKLVINTKEFIVFLQRLEKLQRAMQIK